MTLQPALGISLSGGGLRAAAFSLGCLQALDHEHGVLEGPGCADYLAGVSGGSYTAAGVSLYVRSLQAPGQTRGPDRPFAADSPEARELAAGSDYFLRNGAGQLVDDIVRLVWQGLFELVCTTLWMASVVALAGMALSPFAPQDDRILVPFGVIGLVGFAFLLRWAVVAEPRRAPRPAPWVIGAIVVVGLTAPATALVRRLPFVQSPSWWWQHWPGVLLALAAAYVVLSVWFAIRWPRHQARRTPARVLLAAALELLHRVFVALLVYGLFLYIAVLPTHSWVGPLIAVGVTGVTSLVLLSGGFDASSPHHFYSAKISSCFGLTSPLDQPWSLDALLHLPLSALQRQADCPPSMWRPELDICAAVNRGRRLPPVASVVFTPTELAVHRPEGDVTVDTRVYEQLSMPVGGDRRVQRPALGLFRCVGLSGGAVAPSMGFMTVRAAQEILALLNIRLGRWMPNPANDMVRHLLTFPGPHGTLPGVREMLRELYGWHPSSSFFMYVTDGGHYENLGVVELMRRRCRTIVAVDSSASTSGAALDHSLRLAAGELGVQVVLEPDPHPLWSTGTIHYRDGETGRLLVVRVGVDAGTPANVRERGAAAAWRFPFTPTIDQLYNADKFQAYVDLGRSTTGRALASPQVRDWRLPARPSTP
jgi:hypothetical protein